MRTRKLSLLFLVIVAMLSLSTGLLVSHAQDGLTIGFVQTGSESGWRTDFTNAMMSEAKDQGINLVFVDGQQKQENQIAGLRSLIAQGVDAIILAPLVETGWDDVLQEAKDASIPVLIIDRNVTADPSLFITRVASDFVYEGRLAGAWLLRQPQIVPNAMWLNCKEPLVPAQPLIVEPVLPTCWLCSHKSRLLLPSPVTSPAAVAKPLWKASSARWILRRFVRYGRITTIC